MTLSDPNHPNYPYFNFQLFLIFGTAVGRIFIIITYIYYSKYYI